MIGSAMHNQQWGFHVPALRFQRYIAIEFIHVCPGRQSKRSSYGTRGNRRKVWQNSMIKKTADADARAYARISGAGEACEIPAKTHSETANRARLRSRIRRKKFDNAGNGVFKTNGH